MLTKFACTNRPNLACIAKEDSRPRKLRKNLTKLNHKLPILNLTGHSCNNTDNSRSTRSRRKYKKKNRRDSKAVYSSRQRKHRRDKYEHHRRRQRTSFSIQDPTSSKMTISQVLRFYLQTLTSFEQSELLEYQVAYFLGTKASKVRAIPHTKNNNGYDLKNGDYKICCHDHIGYRFEILGVLGKGSFGQVVKAFDHKTQTYLALKIIKNKRRFHKQGLVEVEVLNLCKKKKGPCILKMIESFYFRNHLCISCELLGMNLYEVISRYNFRGLNLSIIRTYTFQLLQALQFNFKHNIIHCDLKPENILLSANNKQKIKIIDFGSACFENNRMYTYVQSRFYRSPEVILGLSFTKKIDMWSLGCIIAELYTGYPLYPGESEQQQLQLIMGICGPPPISMIKESSRKSIFFDDKDNPKLVANSQGLTIRPKSSSLREALNSNDVIFYDFVESLLQWNPEDRPCPSKALNHPFINNDDDPKMDKLPQI